MASEHCLFVTFLFVGRRVTFHTIVDIIISNQTMEQLVSYEYCLKERIGKAVEFFESHGIDMELEKNSEMKKTVDRRRQFFSVDKDVSVWSLLDLDFDLQRRE